MAEKKKILIRIGSLQGGGAEKVLIGLLNNTPLQNYEVTLLLNARKGVFLEAIPKGVGLKYIVDARNTGGNFIVRTLKKIYRKLVIEFFKLFPALLYFLVLKDKYDTEIAFLHDIIPDIVKSPNKNSEKIGWIHTDLINLKKDASDYHSETIVKYTKRLDQIVFVAEDLMNSHIGKFGFDKNKCTVLYNFIGTKRILELGQENIDFKPSKDHLNLLFVGRLENPKGLDRFLKVLKGISQRHTNLDFKFHIIGEGTLDEELRRLTKRLELCEKVNFIGFKSNPFPYIKACDVVVIPSYYEGFSLVAAEALVLHRAVFSTRVIGPTEFLGEKKYGMLVENNEESIQKGLEDLLLRPDLVSHYKNMAIERAHIFSDKNVVDKFITLINQN